MNIPINAKIKHICDEELPREKPKTFAALYPRRIVPPTGYANPRYFVNTLDSAYHIGLKPELNLLPHWTLYINALKLAEMGVPTYFVRSAFAQAVAQTKPPEDFMFGDIKWPLDAMLFVLPDTFSHNYFGYHVPFLSICRIHPGVYPAILKLPPTEIPPILLNEVDNHKERFVCVFPVYTKTDVPVDYTGAFNMDQQVSMVASAPYYDATYLEDDLYKTTTTDPTDAPAGESEKQFQDKMLGFAVKLMLALTARPGVIKQGVQTRKERRDGRTNRLEREALWSPHTIGWEYEATHSHRPELGGSHASPRLHWRMGHMRNQRHGYQLAFSKLIWIDPVLVGENEE